MNSEPSSPVRSVLVTGAGGFIGSHLVAAQLKRGHRVTALDLHGDRLGRLRGRPGLTLVEGDVANPEVQRRAAAGIDVVFHLAAAHLGASVPESEFRRVNVDGVGTLLEACRAAGVSRFVHCSSVGVYGEVVAPPYDEDSPCRPELPYERTKLEGERLALEYGRREGFPVCVLRPAWVYGPGCPRTEKLFRSIRKGRFVIVGRGDGLRHCVYIADMIEAFELAATVPQAVGDVFVIGDAAAVPVRELVAKIARSTGSRMPISIPAPLFLVGAVALEGVFSVLRKEPPFSRRTMRFFDGNTAFDISRARKRLGYAPGWTLDAGLEATREALARGPFDVADLLEPRP